MKVNGRDFAFALAGLAAFAAVAVADDPYDLKRINARAREIVARMTLEEKVNEFSMASAAKVEDLKRKFDAGACGHVIAQLTLAERREMQEYVLAHSRLGIPTTFQADVVHGYRVMAPIPLAAACSWDEDLVELCWAGAAQEACWAGETLTYAPMVDISDDPRWGRVLETNGEDPYLSGRLAAAQVRGFQGRTAADLASPNRILACGKHFFGYGSLCGGVDCRIRDFSKRDAYETYLPPYREMIKAGLAAVMCTYTGYDAEYATYSPQTRDLLRNYLGFDGLYMTDWDTFAHSYGAGVASSPEECAKRALVEGGIGLSMFGGAFTNLVKLVRRGEVDEKLVDREVVRSIALKIRAGLFEHPFGRGDAEKAKTCDPAIYANARRLAGESILLLKNEGGLLPLKTNETVWVTGPYADERAEVLGMWAQQAQPKDTVTVREGLERAYGVAKLDGWNGDSGKIRFNAKTVVFAFGEPRSWSGEGPASGTLQVPAEQLAELRHVKASGRKVVAVVFAGRPLLLDEILANCDALLYAWYPGTSCGDAIADVLLGRVNPSAKTAQTFPRHLGQLPLTYRNRRPWIRRGYLDIPIEPLFPFGFGMSYTTFAYSAPRVAARTDAAVRVEVDVANTGAREGREIVQVYVRQLKSRLLPRERELREFRAVTLGPGERRTVAFDLGAEAFASFGSDYVRRVEPGPYRVFVGPDSSTTNSVDVCR